MFKWYIFEFCSPKVSGFYFVNLNKHILIAYYDKVIDEFIFYDDACKLLMLDYSHFQLKWSKMPRYSRSQIIDKGYVYL